MMAGRLLVVAGAPTSAERAAQTCVIFRKHQPRRATGPRREGSWLALRDTCCRVRRKAFTLARRGRSVDASVWGPSAEWFAVVRRRWGMVARVARLVALGAMVGGLLTIACAQGEDNPTRVVSKDWEATPPEPGKRWPSADGWDGWGAYVTVVFFERGLNRDVTLKGWFPTDATHGRPIEHDGDPHYYGWGAECYWAAKADRPLPKPCSKFSDEVLRWEMAPNPIDRH